MSQSRLISIAEAASRLGLSEITVYRWTEKGKIPSAKLGGRRLIAEATIDGLIASAISDEVR